MVLGAAIDGLTEEELEERTSFSSQALVALLEWKESNK